MNVSGESSGGAEIAASLAAGQAALRPTPGSFVLFDDFGDSSLSEVRPIVYTILAELPAEWRVVGQGGTRMLLQFHGKGIVEDSAA